MTAIIIGIVIVVVLGVILAALTFHIIEQDEKGVIFRSGRVIGEKDPGLAVIVPFINVLRRV